LDVHVVNGSNERREKMFGLSLKQTIGGIAGIILGIIVSLINPPFPWRELVPFWDWKSRS
jgi:hypothetical protein